MTGFAIDHHALAEMATSWTACDVASHFCQRRHAPAVGDGRSYRELVGPANNGWPTNTLRGRLLTPLVASLRSWVSTPRVVDPTLRSAAPQAVAAPRAETSEPRSSPQIETAVGSFASFERVVQEIKGRLPYIQLCVNASRRRGGQELSRMVAVWSISPDGSVKALSLEGVRDDELAACIQRISRRPLAAVPGVELSIPTPILFVQ